MPLLLEERVDLVIEAARSSLLAAGRAVPDRKYIAGGLPWASSVDQLTASIVTGVPVTGRSSCVTAQVTVDIQVWRALDGRYFAQGIVAPLVDVGADDLDELGREVLRDLQALLGLGRALRDNGSGAQLLLVVPIGTEVWAGISGVQAQVTFGLDL